MFMFFKTSSSVTDGDSQFRMTQSKTGKLVDKQTQFINGSNLILSIQSHLIKTDIP